MMESGVPRDEDKDEVIAALNLHSIVSIADADGRIIMANDEFCRISGYSREELLGQDHRIVNSGHQPAGFWAMVWQQISAAKPWRGEVCNRSKSGALYWVDTLISPVMGASGKVEKYISIRTDVTAAAMAARELGRERLALNNIIEGTHAGTWEWNVETGETKFNQRWAAIVGYTLEELGATTIETWSSFNHPDDVTRAAVLLGRHFDDETPAYEFEGRMRHKNGSWVWAQSRGKLFSRSSDGRPRWMAGTLIDITGRKQAEYELHESRAFLDRTARISGMGGWSVDLLSNEIQWSDQTCLIHEVEPGHQPTFADSQRPFSADSRALMSEALRAGIEKGEGFDLEMPFTTFKGRETWVRAVGEVEFSDKGAARMVGTLQDIGARRQIEADLARSTKLLRGSIEAIDGSFVLFDPDDKMVLCNRSFEQLFDYVPGLIVPGVSFEEMMYAGARSGKFPDAAGRIEEWVAERVAVHQTGNSSLVQRLDDGRSVRNVERRMADGHIVGLRVDVTELVIATEAAQVASQFKSQFVANMSHEIRTPMNAILGMLTLLQRTELTPRQADYASKTEGAARSLLGLLNEILDFSKVEAGKMTLDLQPFSLDRLLADLSVILSANLGTKPVELLFDIDPGLPDQMVGDAMRLQQVLINLCGNAIKFTAKGEVVLSVVLKERDAESVTLELSVKDSGIGIAPENHERIFSGFSQAEASTSRRFGGTGLGVAISQRLVGLMGGRLGLESALGQGSRFCFTLKLPLATTAVDELSPESLTEVEGRPVLIVEENADAQRVLARLVESLGLEVALAANLEQGLTILRDLQAAGRSSRAVLLDWRIGAHASEDDGWKSLQRLREQHQQGQARAPAGMADQHPLLIAALVTSQDQELISKHSEVEQASIDIILLKPLTAAMLRRALLAHQREARHAAAAGPRSIAAPKSQSGQRPLAGMRLLVVDDNLNNQQLAKELLEDAGAEVDLAGDGQQAVDLLRADPQAYRVVLMDMLMPVMDGVTACLIIRSELGLQNLPIVAMTANALASDRRDCLAAGMNEHIAKPFDVNKLIDLVLRLGAAAAMPKVVAVAPLAALPAVAAVSRTPARPIAEPEPAAPAERVFPSLVVPADLRALAAAQGFDVQAAMDRFMGKTGLFQRMATSLAASALQLPEQLRAWLEAKDFASAALAVHSFKGLVATLGGDALALLAADGEAKLKQNEAPDAVWLAEFAAQSAAGAKALEGLSQALNTLKPSAPAPAVSAPALAPTPAPVPVPVPAPVQVAAPTPAVPAERVFPTLAVPDELRALAASQGFDVQGAMDRMMGKVGLFQRMASSLAASALQLPEQLQAWLAAEDFGQATIAVHSFKGLVATLGGDALAKLAAAGEAKLKQNEKPDAAWLAEFAERIAAGAAALDALSVALNALKPSAAAAAKPATAVPAPTPAVLVPSAPVAEPGRARPERRLAGLRLLLVEDNLNNQQIALELLEDEGAIVQVANDGQEAVEKLAASRQSFDLVLMDLQMPVMDGYTATRHIREDLGLTELPIIALTANALDSDRAACLAGGMNEHMGKPFDINKLVALLLQLQRPRA
ncbi:response regulator [Roseateles oligotrophus]|uniref:histidine kinase n=1 Tax=Roseateles oligotrophus TaxID=1769250 RepID=A0ABT2YG09_9BURK|nr:response regulator [Roseateles oligotrophus]MCV2368941.1 response regulator [Roseateles oligotrophus]